MLLRKTIFPIKTSHDPRTSSFFPSTSLYSDTNYCEKEETGAVAVVDALAARFWGTWPTLTNQANTTACHLSRPASSSRFCSKSEAWVESINRCSYLLIDRWTYSPRSTSVSKASYWCQGYDISCCTIHQPWLHVDEADIYCWFEHAAVYIPWHDTILMKK